jgi:transcriptional regulator with XRE-family HTH domain
MTLGEYVDGIMKEKDLKSPEVEKRSGNTISDGYVDNIVKGKAKNVTVEKLKALAVGLETDEEALFRVARGLPPEPDDQAWPPESLSRAVSRVVGSREFLKIVKRMIMLKPTQLKELLAFIERKF